MRIGGGAVSIADVTDRPARDLGFVRQFWLNEIRAGRAFIRGGERSEAGGVFSHLQLINPAGSGITIVVKSAIMDMAASDRMNLATQNDQLTGLAGLGVNLLSGGNAGVGMVRSVNDAGALGTGIAIRLSIGSTPREWFAEWGFELGAGEGILFRPGLVNVPIRGTFQWIEV